MTLLESEGFNRLARRIRARRCPCSALMTDCCPSTVCHLRARLFCAARSLHPGSHRERRGAQARQRNSLRRAGEFAQIRFDRLRRQSVGIPGTRPEPSARDRTRARLTRGALILSREQGYIRSKAAAARAEPPYGFFLLAVADAFRAGGLRFFAAVFEARAAFVLFFPFAFPFAFAFATLACEAVFGGVRPA
jgi:hypothetical protein